MALSSVCFFADVKPALSVLQVVISIPENQLAVICFVFVSQLCKIFTGLILPAFSPRIGLSRFSNHCFYTLSMLCLQMKLHC